MHFKAIVQLVLNRQPRQAFQEGCYMIIFILRETFYESLWTNNYIYGLDWTAKSKTNLAYNLLSPAYGALTL